MRNPRIALAVAIAAVAFVLGIAILPRLDGGSRDPGEPERAAPKRLVRADLTLEQFVRPDTGRPELLVSLPGPQSNRADLVRGTTVVRLRCFDESGRIVVSTAYDWPLVEEVGFPPHIHQPAGEQQLRRIRRCRLTAPGIDYAGVASGG